MKFEFYDPIKDFICAQLPQTILLYSHHGSDGGSIYLCQGVVTKARNFVVANAVACVHRCQGASTTMCLVDKPLINSLVALAVGVPRSVVS